MTPTKEQLADPKWWDENAPEGATHFMIDSDGYVEDAFAVEQDDRYKEVDGDSYLMKSDVVDFGGWVVLARPPHWSGEGLPPVGTVCEVQRSNLKWYRCKIFAIRGDEALFDLDAGHADSWDSGDASLFRPIRTPEQIAAEGREKAIREMLELFVRTNGYVASRMAALYDAGYRDSTEVLAALEALAKAYRQAVGLDGAYDEALLKAESVLSK